MAEAADASVAPSSEVGSSAEVTSSGAVSLVVSGVLVAVVAGVLLAVSSGSETVSEAGCGSGSVVPSLVLPLPEELTAPLSPADSTIERNSSSVTQTSPTQSSLVVKRVANPSTICHISFTAWIT